VGRLHPGQRGDVLLHRHHRFAPWTVVKSNDKKRARLEAMRVVLSTIDYPDKDADVVGVPDPLLVGRPELVYDEGERPIRPHLNV
jgi:hypothetical protein